MHYQDSPYDEDKLVRCTKGAIFDVIVDLRPSSSTYKQWIGFELSEKNQKIVYLPKGIAHGFQTLTDNCQLLYIHSEFYKPDSEGVFNAFDSKLDIAWPLDVTKMSDRDRNSPLID